MKLKTVLPLAFGAAVGYVLGSAAGRARYEELKQRTSGLINHPKVQQTVFDLADDVKNNATKLPGPVSNLVDSAASRLQEKVTHPADSPTTGQATPARAGQNQPGQDNQPITGLS